MHSMLRIFALGIVLVMFLPVLDFAGAQSIPPQDHLKCYQVKDPLKVKEDVHLLSSQFDLAEDCKIIGKERLFCGGVDKRVVDQDPSDFPMFWDAPDRICYRIECPTRQGQNRVPEEVEVEDQFGKRTLTNFNPHYLCTPAFKTEQDCEERAVCGGTCEVGFVGTDSIVNSEPLPGTCQRVRPLDDRCVCLPEPCDVRAECGGACIDAAGEVGICEPTANPGGCICDDWTA